MQGASIKPGDLKFVDVNGDGVINDSDKTELGDPHPSVTMGMNIGFDWKGFDFNVTGYAALGQQVARSWRKFTDGQYENYTTEVYNYWHGEGTSNKYPLLAPGNSGPNWQQVSDLYVENAGFGATWAAPIASLLVEMYLNGEISPERQYLEDRMMTTRFF